MGDALHAMFPTGGAGGNLAVIDAQDVANFLLEN